MTREKRGGNRLQHFIIKRSKRVQLLVQILHHYHQCHKQLHRVLEVDGCWKCRSQQLFYASCHLSPIDKENEKSRCTTNEKEAE